MATLEDLRHVLIAELKEAGIVARAGLAPSDIYGVVPPVGTLLVISLEPLPERSRRGRKGKPNDRAVWLDQVEEAGGIVFYCDDPKELFQILDARIMTYEVS